MNWNNKDNKMLVEAILAIKTPDEAERFLRDLMTAGEIKEFAKRLQTAELLSQKAPYSKIEIKTGLSSTTVARVAKWLKGQGGGYRIILKRLKRNP